MLRVLEVNVDLYLDRLHEPLIKVNFREILEKLKVSAKNNRKKNLVAQVETLEEKLRPFMELVLDEDRGARRNDGNATQTRRGTIEDSFQKQGSAIVNENSNSGFAQPMDRSGRRRDLADRGIVSKKSKKAGNRMDEEEDSMAKAIEKRGRRQKIEEEDEEVDQSGHSDPLPLQSHPVNDKDSEKKPRTRFKNKKSSNSNLKKRAIRRRIVADSDDEEEGEELNLPDDDEDEDYTN